MDFQFLGQLSFDTFDDRDTQLNNSKYDAVKIMSDPILATVIKLFSASNTALKNEKEKSKKKKKEISLLFFFYRVIKRAPISQINTLQIHFEN